MLMQCDDCNGHYTEYEAEKEEEGLCPVCNLKWQAKVGGSLDGNVAKMREIMRLLEEINAD